MRQCSTRAEHAPHGWTSPGDHGVAYHGCPGVSRHDFPSLKLDIWHAPGAERFEVDSISATVCPRCASVVVDLDSHDDEMHADKSEPDSQHPGTVNASVVLAALDSALDVLEDMSIHPNTRRAITRDKLRRLRREVYQQANP